MSLQVDQIIGNYRIVRPLGKGGMGAVYEVVHVQLGVHYALKTYILADENADVFRRRFAAEGRILARLNHPNLVRVIDLNWDEANNVLYYVMDLVLYKDGEARTLDDLEPGGADEDFIYEWFCELCAALAYVHANGIVHRDIKLNNILLAPDKHVVLSDFGISRVCDERLREDIGTNRTLSQVTNGLIVGTRGYMAPEVSMGEPATSAADVYSLGVVFFKLLTGVWYDEDLATNVTQAVAVNRGAANVVKLLEDFARPWKDVLPAMLAADPHARPTDLAHLPERLQVADVPQPPPPKERRVLSVAAKRRVILILAYGIFLLASFVAWRLMRTAPVHELTDDAFVDEAFALPEGLK